MFPISKYKPEATGVCILLLAPVVFGWYTCINRNSYSEQELIEDS